MQRKDEHPPAEEESHADQKELETESALRCARLVHGFLSALFECKKVFTMPQNWWSIWWPTSLLLCYLLLIFIIYFNLILYIYHIYINSLTDRQDRLKNRILFLSFSLLHQNRKLKMYDISIVYIVSDDDDDVTLTFLFKISYWTLV